MINDKEAIRQAVYEIVRTIPFGRATSYGAIAKAIGHPNLSRLVGKIMSTCESATNNMPAHRVVNSQGILSGREAFGSDQEMQRLLEAEGITVVNNHRIQSWKTVFWNPLEEINL
ncbi:methylated-DNA-protein-cysteine methyltransferase-like protein [Parabacteroides sp. PFB2-12]|uniref:MGMT family protein n=1 Tax=unclassified Parabacteroides TaxID=2649774 RepID=UPI002474F862|nr:MULTISPECIES: MGMT family protein [unclassified Parabacteroides]MDH6341987.1 methylated-DNA-protein-cysteine methyltransferase-like protein [Parabacteroides sp. PM6-13]MDH6389685.1 methylated-DNA-protein-cysteine methyltransferase-like protein [Parabacteroides sp. PFB2-12]